MPISGFQNEISPHCLLILLQSGNALPIHCIKEQCWHFGDFIARIIDFTCVLAIKNIDPATINKSRDFFKSGDLFEKSREFS